MKKIIILLVSLALLSCGTNLSTTGNDYSVSGYVSGEIF